MYVQLFKKDSDSLKIFFHKIGTYSIRQIYFFVVINTGVGACK